MNLKRVVVVLAPGFEEVEAIAPIDVLRRAGLDVVVAGLDALSVKSARGVVVQAETTLAQLEGDFDALVLPGGSPGAQNLASSPKVHSIVEKTNSRGCFVAAICAAPALVLGPNGFLNGKNFTCFPGMDHHVVGGIFHETAVVRDGNIITSRGMGTALAFSLALVEALLGRPKAEEVGRIALIGA